MAVGGLVCIPYLLARGQIETPYMNQQRTNGVNTNGVTAKVLFIDVTDSGRKWPVHGAINPKFGPRPSLKRVIPRLGEEIVTCDRPQVVNLEGTKGVPRNGGRK